MSLEALAAAVDIARGLGLLVQEPVPLRSTNNVVAWLNPSPVVAKVGVGRNACLRREIEVARELAALGAPIASPSREVPAVVHSLRGFDVTFWCYHAQPALVEIDGARVASAMSHLHAALARVSPGLRACLPSFMRELESARALLTDSAQLPALAQANRRLLATVFDRLKAELDGLAPVESHVVLHGAPHSYNILLVDDEPIFIDFETTCTGPVEWDMAHLDAEAAHSYGTSLHPQLLWICRSMASVKTATLCWADVDRGDLREHAEWHLEHIKTAIAPNL